MLSISNGQLLSLLSVNLPGNVNVTLFVIKKDDYQGKPLFFVTFVKSIVCLFHLRDVLRITLMTILI